MRDRNELKVLIQGLEPMFLDEATRSGYVCPSCLKSGTGKNGTGIKRIKNSNKYHCFACGYTGDIFDMIGLKFNLSSFPEQLAKACEFYSIENGELPFSLPAARKASPAPPAESEEPAEDCTERFMAWNKSLNEKDCPGLAYMQARGLSLETLNRFCIGFEPAWKHPKTAGNKIVPYSPRVIIPTSATSYLARDIRNPNKLSANQRKYTKSKVGKVVLFNRAALETEGGVVFIVEGEIDAMSIEEAGYPAVGLGSASNKRILIEFIREHDIRSKLVILPDNDEAGQRAAAGIEEEFKAEGIECLVANIFGNCKDANEMLIKDRSLLEASLAALLRQAEKTSARQVPAASLDETNRTALCYMNLHERHRKWLRLKGLTDRQIDKYCYRSAPSMPGEVCMEIKRCGCSFEGNDVFIQDENGNWTMTVLASGILVPERNSKGQIQGFEEIADGHSTLHHPHFRRGERGMYEAVLTDSALKADIVCALTGYSVVALPPDCTEMLIASIFSSLQKRGLRKIHISYDLWVNNPSAEVDKASLKRALKGLGLSAAGMQGDPKVPLDKWLLSCKEDQ